MPVLSGFGNEQCTDSVEGFGRVVVIEAAWKYEMPCLITYAVVRKAYAFGCVWRSPFSLCSKHGICRRMWSDVCC